MKPVKPYPPKTIIRAIPLELFPCHAYIMVTTDTPNIVSNINKHIKKWHNTTSPLPSGPTNSYTAFSALRTGVAYMVLPIYAVPENANDDIRKLPTILRVVAHEAVHISSCITDYVDINYDVNNDEIFAYLNGHIAKTAGTTIIEFCKQNKIPITL